METDCSVPELEEETAAEEADESLEPFSDSNVPKRKKSFVWQYFRPVEGSTKTYECVICNGCVGNQTSNLARHLFATHNIKKQEESAECNTRGRPSRSFIWKYCTKENTKYARCHLCQKLLYFGGGNTGNISKHLRRMHWNQLDRKEFNLQQRQQMMDESNETIHAIASIDSGLDDAAAGPVNDDGKTLLLVKNELSEREASQRRKERKGGSYVWRYCDKLSRHTIRCKLCKKVMSFHGTANVITHLQRRHNIVGKAEDERYFQQNTNTCWPVGDDNENMEVVEGEPNFRTRRRSAAATSVVWKYCTRISKDVVRCCICKKNLSYQGTSNLQRHLHRMHGVVTQGRAMQSNESLKTQYLGNNYIWEHCTAIDDDQIKCNMCDEMFDGKDMDKIKQHLHSLHGVRPMKEESISRRLRKRYKRQRSTDDISDEDDYDNDDDDDSWSKGDDADYVPERNDSSNKKSDSLFDDLIEEDQDETNYDEDPFDPNMLQDYPVATPLSPQSSGGASPDRVQKMYTNSKKLQQLNEERLRVETEYFREKAGYYRMQKYLTALQAKKVRMELARVHNGELNGVYVVNEAIQDNAVQPTQ